jgi:Fe-S oxidoreductase
MLERTAGIDRRRALPQFERQTLHAFVPQAGPQTDAILFADTFTTHYDPEIGVAAVEVLDAAGVRAGVTPHGCCGRPQISKGLLADARRLAAENARALYPIAAAGKPILFCEPSCLSAVREDGPALLRGEERRQAQAVADASRLVEEFLLTRADRLRLRQGPPEVLLHGHCHQKSMGLLAPSRALLSRIPGAAVVDLDAGCCGMAGSFGYAQEHFDVSQAIAERKLLPAIRNRKPGAVVAAAGTSCRHQVRDFAAVKAVHPVVLLQSLLDSGGAGPDANAAGPADGRPVLEP